MLYGIVLMFPSAVVQRNSCQQGRSGTPNKKPFSETLKTCHIRKHTHKRGNHLKLCKVYKQEENHPFNFFFFQRDKCSQFSRKVTAADTALNAICPSQSHEETKWFTPHHRKHDNQLMSTNEIQPHFSSHGQVLLRKSSHWCLRQSAYSLCWHCYSNAECHTVQLESLVQILQNKSQLWHSNLMKSTGLPRLDFIPGLRY